MRCRVANGAEPRAAVQRRCELPLKIPQFITIFHDSQVSKWIKICQNAQLGDCDICQNRSRPRSRYISDHLGPRLGLILLNWRPPEERSIKSFEFLRVTMGIPLPSVTYVFKKRLKNSRDTKTVLYCFDCSLWVLIMRYLRSSIVPKYLFTVMPGIRQ